MAETYETADENPPAPDAAPAASGTRVAPMRLPDLMSVLAPAVPPVARNARLVARLGISTPATAERAPSQVDTTAAGPRRPDRRRAARAIRNTSLRIAARLK